VVKLKLRLNLRIKKRKNYFLKTYSERKGQAILEYIVILSACLFATLGVSKNITSIIGSGIFRLGAQLEQDLKTGRLSLKLWSN